MQPSCFHVIKTAHHLCEGAAMEPVDFRRSPFFSAGFLRRLQKMIPTAHGPATDIERAIERALARIAAIFSAIGRR